MIKWNEITWYSRLSAIILFIGVLPSLAFYIGTLYQQVSSQKTVPSNPIAPARSSVLPVGGYYQPIEDGSSGDYVNIEQLLPTLIRVTARKTYQGSSSGLGDTYGVIATTTSIDSNGIALVRLNRLGEPCNLYLIAYTLPDANAQMLHVFQSNDDIYCGFGQNVNFTDTYQRVGEASTTLFASVTASLH